MEEGDDVIIASISSFIHPLRYNLELKSLPNDVNVTSKLKGRVVIEFRIDDTTLDKLSLNAKNITTTHYKLSLIEENSARAKKRRRRRAEDNNIDDRENAGNFHQKYYIDPPSVIILYRNCFLPFSDCKKNMFRSIYDRDRYSN